MALMSQYWRLALDSIPLDGVIPLDRHPVRAIAAVTLHGEDGTVARWTRPTIADRIVALARRG